MKYAFVILAALLGFSTASAADYPKAPNYRTPVPGYDWSGTIIGIHGAYAINGVVNSPGLARVENDSWFTGGHIGIQRHYGSNMVLGLELEANYSDLSGTTNLGPIGIQNDVTAFGSLRARLGYASGAIHFYGLAGPALAVTEATLTVPGFATSTNQTHLGYTVGGGVEYAVAPNWIVGLEYAYYDFGSENYGFPVAGPIGVVAPADLNFHTVRAKAAFKF